MPFWLKAVILAVVIGGWSGGMFWLGGEHTRKKAAQDKLDTVLTQVKEQRAASKKLQETIDKLPRSQGTIREIVREYPAPCPRPKPVSDGLREAIDKANAARKVSGDS